MSSTCSLLACFWWFTDEKRRKGVLYFHSQIRIWLFREFMNKFSSWRRLSHSSTFSCFMFHDIAFDLYRNLLWYVTRCILTLYSEEIKINGFLSKKISFAFFSTYYWLSNLFFFMSISLVDSFVLACESLRVQFKEARITGLVFPVEFYIFQENVLSDLVECVGSHPSNKFS